MSFEGMIGFFGNVVSIEVMREIHSQKITAEKERDTHKANLVDCEAELLLADKQIEAEKVKFSSMEQKYNKEVKKNVNTNIVLNDYKKKANTGKIMTIIGGVGVGVGVAGILYGVLSTR